MTTRTEATVAAALTYARRDWLVFPCRPDSKEPATRHGFHDATTDPDQIRAWWQQHPDANLAIATGHSGPDVLDVDQHGSAGNGYYAYHQLTNAGLLADAHAIVATPNGGLHAYFSGSAQPCSRLPRHHLDFKAAGGYVLAPPSQIGGRPYRLLLSAPQRGGLNWAAVTRLLEPAQDRSAQPRTPAPGDLSRLTRWVERLTEGNRNSGLHWAACRAIEAGQPELLGSLADAAAKTGLGNSEITRTLASAFRSIRHDPEPHPDREAGL